MSQVFPATVVRFPRRRHPDPPPFLGGVPERALESYRWLAERGESTPAELAGRLSLPKEQAQAIVAELTGMKLVRGTDLGGLVAVPAGQAVDDLLTEQAQVLTQALRRVSEGQHRLQTLLGHRTVLDRSEASRISSTTVGGSAQRGMFDMPGEAVEAISAINLGGSFSDELLRRSLARAEENARRHVRMRVIHQTSALRHPGVAAYLAKLTAMGCRVRVRDNLPFRLLLIDGVSAVCSVPSTGSYLLRGERVMVLLDRIFETTWVDAVPVERAVTAAEGPFPAAVGEGGAGASRGTGPVHVVGLDDAPGTLNSAHHAVLRLLAEGHTDQSIARALGVTTRTVGRRISEIYHLLEVDSRFQAGIRARELGIV